MKVSYEERLAIDVGLRRSCVAGDDTVLSVRAGGSVGQLMSSEILTSVCRLCPVRGERNIGPIVIWRDRLEHGGVLEPMHARKSKTRQ